MMNATKLSNYLEALASLSDRAGAFALRDAAIALNAARSGGMNHQSVARALNEDELTFLASVRAISSGEALKAVNLVSTFVRNPEHSMIRDFLAGLAPTISPADVAVAPDDYVEALRQALHDAEAFRAVFARLKADRGINQRAAVEIAARLAYPMAQSTPKKVAFERIWRLHEASESFAAKTDAMKGKSAA